MGDLKLIQARFGTLPSCVDLASGLQSLKELSSVYSTLDDLHEDLERVRDRFVTLPACIDLATVSGVAVARANETLSDRETAHSNFRKRVREELSQIYSDCKLYADRLKAFLCRDQEAGRLDSENRTLTLRNRYLQEQLVTLQLSFHLFNLRAGRVAPVLVTNIPAALSELITWMVQSGRSTRESWIPAYQEALAWREHIDARNPLPPNLSLIPPREEVDMAGEKYETQLEPIDEKSSKARMKRLREIWSDLGPYFNKSGHPPRPYPAVTPADSAKKRSDSRRKSKGSIPTDPALDEILARSLTETHDPLFPQNTDEEEDMVQRALAVSRRETRGNPTDGASCSGHGGRA